MPHAPRPTPAHQLAEVLGPCVPDSPIPPTPAFPCPLLFPAKLSLAKGTQFVLEENRFPVVWPALFGHQPPPVDIGARSGQWNQNLALAGAVPASLAAGPVWLGAAWLAVDPG